MPERARIVFGESLDRESGIMATAPASMEHLLNVYLFHGKAQVRRGARLDSTYVDDLGAPISHVAAIQALQTDRSDVIAGYQQADRRMHVFLRSGVRLGEWFTLAPAATIDPPLVSTTDARGKVFLAHDEPLATVRAPTLIYDPWEVNVLTELRADLAGENLPEPPPIRFRGVTKHLKYLFGWGFGTNLEKNRPELLRVSLPGQPTVFMPEHYFMIGQRQDPILTCVPVGQVLLVFKETEIYQVIGYDRATFGERPVDTKFGVANSRLAVEYDGHVFFWSRDGGPRVTTGGASEDLALPLDLEGPQPQDLVAEGALEYGFATYVPRRRLILFIFGQRAYALSLRSRPWKWSYMGFGFPVYSAGVSFAPGTTGPAAPAGHPAFDSVPEATSTSLTVQFDNIGSVGDEVVEVHVKRSIDPTWPASPAAVDRANADQDQRIVVKNLQPDTDYDIALRYRRGGIYHPDYDDNPAFDPGSWPAVSRGTGRTTFAAPKILSAVWRRTAGNREEITLSWENREPNAQTHIYRDGVLIHMAAAGESTYGDAGITDEAYHEYTLRHFDPVIPAESPDSAPVKVWAGPPRAEILEFRSLGADTYMLRVRLPEIPWSTVSDIQFGGQKLPQDIVNFRVFDWRVMSGGFPTVGETFEQVAQGQPATSGPDGYVSGAPVEQTVTVRHVGGAGDVYHVAVQVTFRVPFSDEEDLSDFMPSTVLQEPPLTIVLGA